MAVDSLREEELGQNDAKAFARFVEADAYTPDLEAYKVDEANDPYKRLNESIRAGATFELRLTCKDGRREVIKLDNTESGAWLTSPLSDRFDFADVKICERRATVAYKTAKRLQERGQQPIPKNVTPEEESYLREFGLIEDVTIAKPEGGYRKGVAIRESAVQSIRLREDGFWDGSFDGGASGFGYDAPSQREYLPRGGPAGQQQQISDVWDTQAKCYYAWTHDPVIKAACEMIADFTLGRGVTVKCEDDKVQAVVDEWLKRDKMKLRLHSMVVGLSRDGDKFLRFMPLGDGRLKIRTAPAATIWEVITDAEDPMDVYWYVQRYQTRYQLFAPPGLSQAKCVWVERMIPAAEMEHIKINAEESDVRGKPDPYPALGWAKRLRDFFDAIVQKEESAASYQWKYIVDGGAADIQRVMQNIVGRKAAPGSVFAGNKLTDVTAVSSGVKTVSGDGSVYEALLNHIALAFILTKSYFGASSKENRASALVDSEPTAKHLETRQDVVGYMYSQMVERVIAEAKKFGLLDGVSKFGFKATFPAIIKADAGTRAAMIRTGQASNYLSMKTSAEQWAGEAEIEGYNFDDEIAQIKKEQPDQNPYEVTAKDLEQVKRGAPLKTDPAFAPGTVPNLDANGNPVPPPNGATHPPAVVPQDQASPTSSDGQKKIQDERGRGGKEDKTTMEAFRETARELGVIVIYP